MRFLNTRVCALLLLSFSATAVLADRPMAPMRADGHAPIGVMGDHRHHAGGLMLSYRFMHMDMQGNQIGDDDVSPESIVTSVANPFFGQPMQPPTLRVVPTKMTMQMHMFGLMYAPNDWLTLAAMLNYSEKEMDHITFAGGAGTVRLGTFTTSARGLGDTSFSGLIRLLDAGHHKIHANVGLSVPTGSTSKTDTILTPTGARPQPRLPYAMQLGSGTLDFLPGLTYTGRYERVAWGGQYAGTVRTERDNGYQWGDKHALTMWSSFSPRDWISLSARLKFSTQGRINGRDRRIVAPVQTADPNNFGGERIDLLFGLNLVGQSDITRGHRIAIEGGIPLEQDLNGVQMETDYTLTVGWQFAF